MSRASSVSDRVWSAEDTTPGAIEAALRKLLEERHGDGRVSAPARVLNLVAVVDCAWRGEIATRLERVGRNHPSRTVVCSVEPGRRTIDAWTSMECELRGGPGAIGICREHVEVDVGEEHLGRLASIVDPLLVSDLATVVWAPHGHSQAVDALLGLAQVVLIDSGTDPDPVAAAERSRELVADAYVVDLAWLRTTPWRERIAASFNPPALRRTLAEISSLTIEHAPASAVSALLLAGWLASRLGWDARPLTTDRAGARAGVATAGRGEVAIRLSPTAGQDVPGLAAVTIETASGASLSLRRASGGLAAVRRTPAGHESSFVVLGASRGESGILGEGIRQALLRDPAAEPARAAAATMVCATA